MGEELRQKDEPAVSKAGLEYMQQPVRPVWKSWMDSDPQ